MVWVTSLVQAQSGHRALLLDWRWDSEHPEISRSSSRQSSTCRDTQEGAPGMQVSYHFQSQILTRRFNWPELLEWMPFRLLSMSRIYSLRGLAWVYRWLASSWIHHPWIFQPSSLQERRLNLLDWSRLQVFLLFLSSLSFLQSDLASIFLQCVLVSSFLLLALLSFFLDFHVLEWSS